jgi:quercetin dioxygenase-like cupin family protein
MSLALLASVPACARQTGAAARASAPGATVADSQSIRISRRGARPTQQGPAEQFTGAVCIEPLFAATAQSRAAGASVSFEPGARTAWHTHPRGQILIVTMGVGRVRRRGGPVAEIRPGDVVWTPPGVEHWHGAAPTTAMTHIAIQEHLDGRVVEWMEKVTNEEYDAGRSGR